MTDKDKFIKPAGTGTESTKEILKTVVQTAAPVQKGDRVQQLPGKQLHYIPSNGATFAMMFSAGERIADKPDGPSVTFGNMIVVDLTKKELEKIMATFPQAASQMFIMIEEAILDQNSIEDVKAGRAAINSTVVFSLIDYGLRRGLLSPEDIPTDYDPDKTERFQEKLKNISKEVRKNIKCYEHTTAPWKQNSRTRAAEITMGSYLLRAKGAIKNRHVVIILNDEVSRAMLESPLSTIHDGLLKIPQKDSNAFRIGCQICLLNGLDANKRQGRSNIFSIMNLLELTDFAEVKKAMSKADPGTLRPVGKIINPFCDLMTRLSVKPQLMAGEEETEEARKATHYGILDSWEICKAKGEPLTDDELADVMTDWTKFKKLYVKVKIAGNVDEKTALEEANTRKANADARKNHKKLPGNKGKTTKHRTASKGKTKKSAKPKTVYTPIGEDEELY